MTKLVLKNLILGQQWFVPRNVCGVSSFAVSNFKLLQEYEAWLTPSCFIMFSNLDFCIPNFPTQFNLCTCLYVCNFVSLDNVWCQFNTA